MSPGTRVAGMPHRGDDAVHHHGSPLAGACIGATPQPKERGAKGVRHLPHELQAHRLAVIDPFERHAGAVRAQHLLSQTAGRHGIPGVRKFQFGMKQASRGMNHPPNVRKFGCQAQSGRGQTATTSRQGEWANPPVGPSRGPATILMLHCIHIWDTIGVIRTRPNKGHEGEKRCPSQSG